MYSEINKVDSGRLLDIKVVDYFIAEARNVEEQELKSAITKVCRTLRNKFEEEMYKEGYLVSCTGAITRLK